VNDLASWHGKYSERMLLSNDNRIQMHVSRPLGFTTACEICIMWTVSGAFTSGKRMIRFLMLTLFLLLPMLLTGCEASLNRARRLQDKSDELYEMGQYEEALEAIDQAIELKSGVSEFHETRGYVLESLGKHSEAIVEYRKALSLDPENFWAKNNYVSILCLSPNAKDRNGDEAVKLGRELLRFAEKSDDDMMKTYAQDTYGSALAEVGWFEKAVESCEKALLTAAPDERELIETNIANYREGRRTRYPTDGSYGVFPEDEQ